MKHLLYLLLLNNPAHSIAQAGINSNGALPDPRSKLDISSTEKGLLSPRMSASQRDQYRAQFDEWENPRFLSRQQCTYERQQSQGISIALNSGLRH